LVAHGGEVADHVGAFSPSSDGSAVVDHLVHRHRQGGAMPLNHHSQGVAYQDGIRSRFVENPRKRRVVSGYHADLLADLLKPLKRLDGDLFLHGSPPLIELNLFAPEPFTVPKDQRRLDSPYIVPLYLSPEEEARVLWGQDWLSASEALAAYGDVVVRPFPHSADHADEILQVLLVVHKIDVRGVDDQQGGI